MIPCLSYRRLVLLLFGFWSCSLAVASPDEEEEDVVVVPVGKERKGRVISGSWRNLPFDLYYYIDMREVTGPQKRVSCVKQSLESTFLPPLQDSSLDADHTGGGGGGGDGFQMTRVQEPLTDDEDMKKALQYAEFVATNEAKENADRKFHIDQREQKNADGHVMYGPVKRVETLVYRCGAMHPPLYVPTDVAYRWNLRIALYLNGKPVDTYLQDETVLSVATPTEFETFVHQIVPPAFQKCPYEEFEQAKQECWQQVGTEDSIWQDADKVWLTKNATALGRKVTGVWTGTEDTTTTTPAQQQQHAYEIFSFLHFLRLSPEFDSNDDLQECFYDAVNDGFFEDEVDDTVRVSDISPHEAAQLKHQSFVEVTQMANDKFKEDSVFGTFSLGRVGCSGFSVLHGVVISLDKNVVESTRELPTGFDVFVQTIVQKLLATPFALKDSMDYSYEIKDIARDFDLLQVLGFWMEECQYPPRPATP